MVHILPFLNKYELINPFKRNRKNANVFFEFLYEIVDASKDEKSVFCQMKKLGFSKEIIIHDLHDLFLAGTETSSRTVTSVLYHLKKYPEVMKKLESELFAHFDKYSDNDGKFDKDKILEFEYLNNVIKEALRIDPPSFESLASLPSEDITICGVDIPKGSPIKLQLVGAHFNPEEWVEPYKFIPERYDPNSKYFFKPNSDKPRSPYAYVPFSQGPRSCPGRTIAMLQMKVILIYLLCKMDYTIDQEFLDKEGVAFPIYSQFQCEFTVTKI